MKKFSKLLCFITLLVITLVVPNVYAESNVAKVNNEECATWEDVKQKITEAESPITIQLLSTVSLDDTLVIPSGKTVTFDLNGQELQALHGKGYGIQNLGDLTITSTNQGGKLSLNTEKGSGVINSGTSLKIENITIWAGKTYAAIKNSNDDDVVRTLVVKSTEITGQFAPGIHAAGNVTIEDVKFSLSPAATLIAIPGGEEDTEVTVTNMETKSRGFVYVGDGIKGLESLDGKEGKAKLKIENVTGNTVLVGKKDSVIEGDEAMTKKAISFAEDGASIIIPEGYNEEIPNK